MIAKTEIANDSKIRLRFENLTGKKRFENLSFANKSKIKLRFENLTGKKTIQKFIIVDKFCNRYFLIFGTMQIFKA